MPLREAGGTPGGGRDRRPLIPDEEEQLGFDAGICDLCGAWDRQPLLDIAIGRSMRSDRALVARDLKKCECAHCGLVRGGTSLTARELSDLYTRDYSLNVRREHLFYPREGAITRSRVICHWLLETGGTRVWQTASRALEVGAGAGTLMREIARRVPGMELEGLELSAGARELATRNGLRVHGSRLDQLAEASYDLIYAVGVIEHVPSPAAFLGDLRRVLRSGGLLILCQPTQDVASYDLFLFDHLHHFATDHLRRYALRYGFEEESSVVGHRLMPNFSLHFWRKTDLPESFEWIGEPVRSACRATAERIAGDLERLDATLGHLRRTGRRMALFGLNEVYWLARIYSVLSSYELVCGLDDRPDDPEYRKLPFPVVAPERAPALGVQDVLLTMNKIYYPQASKRLEQLGLRPHPVLS